MRTSFTASSAPKTLTPVALPPTPCAFHPEHTLTNFCGCRECLLPLCPSCIAIHLGEHGAARTTPCIENIASLIEGLQVQLHGHSTECQGQHNTLVRMEVCRRNWNALSTD